MKICDRGLNWIQVINMQGDVVGCSWAENNYFGNIFQESWEEILNSKNAREFREKLLKGDYSNCPKERCRFLANNTLEEHCVEWDGVIDHPIVLLLAYENTCNYRCTCCTSHEEIGRFSKSGYEDSCKEIKEIERKIKEIMPHLKIFGANGRGELFASKSILKLLSEWKPISPENEIRVRLETNGSLFDEEHWKQIENLGRYHLQVAITVMSFNEGVYQYLSGTKYPITKIENNLRFVKRLREAGIINELELATVLQEANFREMPEFTRRCIEEFGADSVRLRPVFPGGSLNENMQWFMDVRNPMHPYYKEYKSIMQNPIFRNPKVCIWSGEEDSAIGEMPLKREVNDLEGEIIDLENQVNNLQNGLQNEIRVSRLLKKIIMEENVTEMITSFLKEEGIKNVVVYGVGVLGKAFIKSIDLSKVPLKYIVDQNYEGGRYNSIQVVKLDVEKIKGVDGIIVTPIRAFEEIRAGLEGYEGKVFSLEKILCRE